MKKVLLIALSIASLTSCKKEVKKNTETKEKVIVAPTVTEIASFKGQQVTGVTVSTDGRVFVNFPRWRQGVTTAVAEVKKGKPSAFPNDSWNNWEIGKKVSDSVFVAVQSVVAFENDLYVLDTRNPEFKGVIDPPKLFVFDLSTNKLKKTYTFPESSYHKDSYINDLRVDKENGSIYLTDSGHAGLIVLNMETTEAKRVLDNNIATKAEVDHLTIDGQAFTNVIHSDGIALNPLDKKLYFHALSGYTLYAIDPLVLIHGTDKEIAQSVEKIAKTSAPDGMIYNSNGDLYYGDLEQNAIMKRDVNGVISIFVKGDEVKWPDTFSIHNNTLYYTNSRISEVDGPIDGMSFTLNTVKL